MTNITLQQEDQVVEEIVTGLNDLVEKHDLFLEAGKLVYKKINALGNLGYGEQARIIRKVAEHPNLKYSPHQVKEAWITVSKFPQLVSGAHHQLPSSKYNLLARTRLTSDEIEKFEREAIDKIKPDPNQPRKTFDGIDELAESIKKEGVLQPLLVNKDNYIIDGERRYKAAKIAGLKEIPIVYIDVPLQNGNKKETLQLIADVHHKGLPILERDEAMFELWRKMGKPSHQTLASALSVSKSVVTDALERAQFAPKLSKSVAATTSGRIITETKGLPENVRKKAVEKMTRENIRTDEGIRTIVSRLREAKSEEEQRVTDT